MNLLEAVFERSTGHMNSSAERERGGAARRPSPRAPPQRRWAFLAFRREVVRLELRGTGTAEPLPSQRETSRGAGGQLPWWATGAWARAARQQCAKEAGRGGQEWRGARGRRAVSERARARKLREGLARPSTLSGQTPRTNETNERIRPCTSSANLSKTALAPPASWSH